MQGKNEDVLASLRKSVKEAIEKNYESVEQFCWDTDLPKSTVSNFLRSKKDFQVSTLNKIAKALKKNLIIKLS